MPPSEEVPLLRHAARSFVLMGASSLAGQAIGFAVLVLVARRIGPAYLGGFAFAANLSRSVFLLANLGIPGLAIRDVSRTPRRVTVIAGEVLLFRSVIGVMCFCALLVVRPFVSPDQASYELFPLAALFFLVDVFSLDWALQGLQRFRAVSFLRLLGQCIYGILAPFLITVGLLGAQRYAWLNILGSFVALFGFGVVFVRVAGRPHFSLTLRRLGTRIRQAAPVGLSLAMTEVYFTLPFVLLGYAKGSSTVGQFSVAFKVAAAFWVIAGLWGSVVYPHASRVYIGDPAALGAHIAKSAGVIAALVLPLGMGGSILGPRLVIAIFGDGYAEAGAIFAILVWACVLWLLTANFDNVLLACGGERSYAAVSAIGAVVNCGVAVAVVVPFGAAGMAIAMVASSSILLLGMRVMLGRRLSIPSLNWRRIGGSCVATAAMSTVLLTVGSAVGPWTALALATGTFALAASMLRVVPMSELRSLASRRREPR